MRVESGIVEFKDVHKAFGKQKVLNGLSLSIPKDKITFIIGQSGEGKSVTLKHIVGILRPDAGEVVVDGASMSSAKTDEWIQTRRKVGILFQDGALFDSLTVFANVAFPLLEFTKLRGAALASEVTRLLNEVGLPGKEEIYPSELSIGEKKRVGLARALALKPKLLLYDEPTTSMDPLIAELIDDLIVETQKRTPGISSVVVSHDLRSILSIADHIILLVRGKTYLAGSVADFQQSSDPLIRQFLSGGREGPLSQNSFANHV